MMLSEYMQINIGFHCFKVARGSIFNESSFEIRKIELIIIFNSFFTTAELAQVIIIKIFQTLFLASNLKFQFSQ